jgi:hypothetical protein
MRPNNAAPWALIVLVLLGACRQDDGKDIDENVVGDGGPDVSPLADTSIVDIQMGKVAAGTEVRLEGVVVTAVDAYGKRQGGLYVQEPAGGEHSGVFVFNPTVVAQGGLVPGDIVTVTGGFVQEYAHSSDTSGKTLTELSSPKKDGMIVVTKTGAGELPKATEVSSVALAEDDAEAEKWEGVLVRVVNVAAVSAPREVSAMTDPLLTEFKITGPLPVSSSLTALTKDMVPSGTCYASITGVVDYFFDYKLVPRAAGDLVAGGTSCPPKESACENKLDDDHNGYADCADFACQDSLPSCATLSTVFDIQSGTVKEGAFVKVEDVVVTAAGDNMLWVQETAETAAKHGVSVFNKDGFASTFSIGDVVTVIGEVDEFMFPTDTDSLTRIRRAQVTKISTGAVPDAVLTANPADLTKKDTAEDYEGVLVSVANVRVVSAPDEFGVWSVGDGASPLSIDDLLYRLPTTQPAHPVVGDCFRLIRGPLHYDFGRYKIIVRSADDVVLGGTCQ